MGPAPSTAQGAANSYVGNKVNFFHRNDYLRFARMPKVQKNGMSNLLIMFAKLYSWIRIRGSVARNPQPEQFL